MITITLDLKTIFYLGNNLAAADKEESQRLTSHQQLIINTNKILFSRQKRENRIYNIYRVICITFVRIISKAFPLSNVMSCLAMERLKQLINRYSLSKSHLGRHSDSVKVTFVNYCEENISIHWVDYDGHEVEYFAVDEVGPGER